MLKKLTSLLLSSFVVVSCTGETTTQTKLQYMPDMADAPTVKAQESYIDPPDYSVATTAILYPDTAEESEELLQNPFTRANPDQFMENGKVLYETFCLVCHGPQAKGNGNLTDRFPQPPDLTVDFYKGKKDGFFFHRITFGSAIMPSLGHATSPHERWQIILYLRNLQQKAAK